MKANQVLGIVLIVLGVAAFAYQGINYTTRETAIDIGPVQVTTERSRRLPLPPIVGAVALVGGLVLLVVGKTK
jgi:drug/metabolite transporter (DMT)-like permease